MKALELWLTGMSLSALCGPDENAERGPALDHHSLAIWAGITAIGKPALRAAMAESF